MTKQTLNNVELLKGIRGWVIIFTFGNDKMYRLQVDALIPLAGFLYSLLSFSQSVSLKAWYEQEIGND